MIITITPIGGSVTINETSPQHRTIHVTPNGTPFTLTISSDGSLVSFTGAYRLPSIPKLTHGGVVNISITR